MATIGRKGIARSSAGGFLLHRRPLLLDRRLASFASLVVLMVSCSRPESLTPESETPSPQPPPDNSQLSDHNTPELLTESETPDPSADDEDAGPRGRMVARQLAGRDIRNQRVLEAMRRVPRHRFVPIGQEGRAYVDSPLPIGHGQTISQPYIVALMTQLVHPGPESKALDIGTGSGYQAAVLAEIVDSVYSIEIIEPLANEARKRLAELGYKNVFVRHGNGYRGWPEQAPFDIIVVAAAPEHVPQRLVEQLAPGGKMVIPVGKLYQTLLLIEKSQDGQVSQRSVATVAFVPMTGDKD